MTGTSLIDVDEKLGQFHLTNGRVSLILKVVEGKLINLYTGAAVLGRRDFGYIVDDGFRVQATIADEHGATRLQLGINLSGSLWISTVMLLGAPLGCILSAAFVDRIGRKRTIVPAFVVIAVFGPETSRKSVG